MQTRIETNNPIRNIEIIEKIGNSEPEINLDRYKESMDFKKKHLTVKSKVLSILRSDKQARKDDFWLMLLYYVKSGHIKLIIPLEEFSKINKPESISRCRRELIKEAKQGVKELQFLLKDTETLNKRENLENLNHDYYQDKNNGVNSQWVK